MLEPLIASGPRVDQGAEEPMHVLGSEELWDELDLPDVLRAPVRPIMPEAGADDATGDVQSDLVAFLASDRAANVTGADFVIDGGLTSTL